MIAIAPTPEDMARRETAKLLREITGLGVTILPPDGYGRLPYEFNLKPKDENQKAGVEGGPFLAGECSDYLQKLIHLAKEKNPVLDVLSFVAVQISPKNDWQTAVNLYFSDPGLSGFSTSAQQGLEAAKEFKKGMEEASKAYFGKVDLPRYQQEIMEQLNLNFVDGTERKREL